MLQRSDPKRGCAHVRELHMPQVVWITQARGCEGATCAAAMRIQRAGACQGSAYATGGPELHRVDVTEPRMLRGSEFKAREHVSELHMLQAIWRIKKRVDGREPRMLRRFGIEKRVGERAAAGTAGGRSSGRGWMRGSHVCCRPSHPWR